LQFPYRALIGLSLLGGALAAQAGWFTVAGVAGDDRGDYVQVDPVSLRSDGARRWLDVRVSRAAERTSTEGVRFRSFEGVAEVDCSASTARYVSATFYAEPHFAGTPIARLDYASDRVRPMAFRQIPGDFSARVIRAACTVEPSQPEPPPSSEKPPGPGRDGPR
jgi:hypothetical protein